jgi:hypothetical protein
MGVTFKQTGEQIGFLIVSVDSLMGIEIDVCPIVQTFRAILTSEMFPSGSFSVLSCSSL